MTRTSWLVLGVLAMVAVSAVVLSRRGPARIDAVQAESDVSSAQAQVLALAATLQGAREQVQVAMSQRGASVSRGASIVPSA